MTIFGWVIDWETVKSTAAIWGALLSTLLALAKLFEQRPLATLESYEPDAGTKQFYQVRISNPCTYPIFIKKVRVIYPRDAAFYKVGAMVRRPELFSESTNASINLMIPGGAEAEVRFALVDAPKQPIMMIIRVHWFKNQPLILPRWPILIFRTRCSLTALADDPVTDNPSKD